MVSLVEIGSDVVMGQIFPDLIGINKIHPPEEITLSVSSSVYCPEEVFLETVFLLSLFGDSGQKICFNLYLRMEKAPQEWI